MAVPIGQTHHITNLINNGEATYSLAKKHLKNPFSFATDIIFLLNENNLLFGILPANSNVPSLLRGISLGCSIISIPSSISKIVQIIKQPAVKVVDKIEKGLAITEKISAIGSACLACFQLTELFISFLSQVSCSFGNFTSRAINSSATAAQSAISVIAPFAAVLSSLDILQSIAEIGIHSINLYRTQQKVNAIVSKKKIWKNLNWKQLDEPTKTFSINKLEHLERKQLESKVALNALKKPLLDSTLAYTTALFKVDKKQKKLKLIKSKVSNENAVKRIFSQIVPTFKLVYAELYMKSIHQKYEITKKKFDVQEAKHKKRIDKISNWSIIVNKVKNSSLSSIDKKLIKKFSKKQIYKLQIKKRNLRLNQLKTGLDIALKVVVIITLIASIVLTFSGVAAPIGIITGMTLGLFLIALKYGLKSFKSYKKPELVISRLVPRLSI